MAEALLHYDEGSAPRGKKERSNAKAVECLDLEGNLLATYRSGINACHTLGIGQGDISLCCRGMKHAVGGYRFRFVGDIDPEKDYKEAMLRKKTFAKEAQRAALTAQAAAPEPELGRSRRATRIEYNKMLKIDEAPEEKKQRLAPKEALVRKWTKERVSVGGIVIHKYIPSTSKLNPLLQDMLPQKPKARTGRARVHKRKRMSTAGGLYDL